MNAIKQYLPSFLVHWATGGQHEHAVFQEKKQNNKQKQQQQHTVYIFKNVLTLCLHYQKTKAYVHDKQEVK